jgi:hypothetical protein
MVLLPNVGCTATPDVKGPGAVVVTIVGPPSAAFSYTWTMGTTIPGSIPKSYQDNTNTLGSDTVSFYGKIPNAPEVTALLNVTFAGAAATCSTSFPY